MRSIIASLWTPTRANGSTADQPRPGMVLSGCLAMALLFFLNPLALSPWITPPLQISEWLLLAGSSFTPVLLPVLLPRRRARQLRLIFPLTLPLLLQISLRRLRRRASRCLAISGRRYL